IGADQCRTAARATTDNFGPLAPILSSLGQAVQSGASAGRRAASWLRRRELRRLLRSRPSLWRLQAADADVRARDGTAPARARRPGPPLLLSLAWFALPRNDAQSS